MRVSKTYWYRAGGLENPKLYRKQTKAGYWLYYEDIGA